MYGNSVRTTSMMFRSMFNIFLINTWLLPKEIAKFSFKNVLKVLLSASIYLPISTKNAQLTET